MSLMVYIMYIGGDYYGARKTCESCAYYVQHYRKSKKGYSRVAWGHCTTPRTKPRLMETPSCPHYKEREGAGKGDSE